MTDLTKVMRREIEVNIDRLEMMSWNDGYEAAINAIDELSNHLHNTDDALPAEILRWAAKELRGENIEEAN